MQNSNKAIFTELQVKDEELCDYSIMVQMLGQINLYLGVQGLRNHKLISKELLKQALHTSEKWIRIKNLTWNIEKCDVEQTAKVIVKSECLSVMYL